MPYQKFDDVSLVTGRTVQHIIVLNSAVTVFGTVNFPESIESVELEMYESNQENNAPALMTKKITSPGEYSFEYNKEGEFKIIATAQYKDKNQEPIVISEQFNVRRFNEFELDIEF